MSVLRVLLVPRPSVAASLLCSLASQMMWWASPAEAQGFFQQLFGMSPPQVQSAPRASIARQPLGGSAMHIAPSSSAARWTAVGPEDASSGGSSKPGKEGTGSYTTVCVRLCDGFFFPISHKAPRSRFYRDAEACRSRCSESESQLFYYSTSGGDMRSAVDLTGRAYARLPFAFMHRKKMVQGCGCRPEAWSDASLARHYGYAIAEGVITVAGSRSQGAVTVVAGNYPGPEAAQDPPAQSTSANASGSVQGAGAEPMPDPRAATADTAPDANSTPDQASGDHTLEAPSSTVPAAGTVRPAFRSPRGVGRLAAGSTPKQATARGKPARMAAATTGPAPKYTWPGDPSTRTR